MYGVSIGNASPSPSISMDTRHPMTLYFDSGTKLPMKVSLTDTVAGVLEKVSDRLSSSGDLMWTVDTQGQGTPVQGSCDWSCDVSFHHTTTPRHTTITLPPHYHTTTITLPPHYHTTTTTSHHTTPHHHHTIPHHTIPHYHCRISSESHRHSSLACPQRTQVLRAQSCQEGGCVRSGGGNLGKGRRMGA